MLNGIPRCSFKEKASNVAAYFWAVLDLIGRLIVDDFKFECDGIDGQAFLPGHILQSPCQESLRKEEA